MKTFRKTPSQISFEDTLSETLRKTPSHPPEDPFAPSFEDSFATLFEDPLEDLPESPFDSHLEAPPPFRIPSEHAACPESFWSRREALPSAPFEAFAGTFFGVFRRRPRAPSANDASPSGSPRVIIPGSPRMRHVSPEAPSAPQASRKLPSASRAPRVTPPRQPPNATPVPEYPARDFLRMSPRMPPVPECLTRKPHPEALRVRHVFPSTQPGELPGCSRAGHVSRVAEPREPLPGALRVSRAPRTPPGTLRVPPAREPRTERPPGHSASAPRVPGSAFFRPKFRKCPEN